MQRTEWEFEFTTEVLKKACDAKVAFHAERHAEWTKKRDEAEAKLRTEGIDFRSAAQFKSLDQGYTTSLSNTRPKPVFDDELLNAFNEAQAKVDEHAQRLRDYASYQRAFGLLVERSEGGKKFGLNADDVQYFGL